MPSRLLTLALPDFDTASDEEIAELARRRDGRWSDQTKELLAKFGTTLLDLNSAWAATPMGWCCPCCHRDKTQLARVSAGGVLLCRLESHHDHLADHARRLFSSLVVVGDERDHIIQASRAKDALMPFVERFERTLVCIDCNLAEGMAKMMLTKEIEAYFTFTPNEIASFIRVRPNRVHEVDGELARRAWLAVQDDVADRLEFTRRMAARLTNGKHRREVTHADRFGALWEDRDIVWKLATEGEPRLRGYLLGSALDGRSVSYNSAGKSPKPKTKPRPSALSDAEFAEVEATKRDSKPWILAGESWTCPCCARSKREIWRRSNRGRWTASIHRFREWYQETDPNSLDRRRRTATSQLVIGGWKELLLCQDCRNIVAEVQRRTGGLSPNCLTLENLQQVIAATTLNGAHEVNFDEAIQLALANRPLMDAVNDFHEHENEVRSLQGRLEYLMKFMPWTRKQARDLLGYEYSKARDLDIEEGDAQIDWMLDEATRLSLERGPADDR